MNRRGFLGALTALVAALSFRLKAEASKPDAEQDGTYHYRVTLFDPRLGYESWPHPCALDGEEPGCLRFPCGAGPFEAPLSRGATVRLYEPTRDIKGYGPELRVLFHHRESFRPALWILDVEDLDRVAKVYIHRQDCTWDGWRLYVGYRFGRVRRGDRS